MYKGPFLISKVNENSTVEIETERGLKIIHTNRLKAAEEEREGEVSLEPATSSPQEDKKKKRRGRPKKNNVHQEAGMVPKTTLPAIPEYIPNKRMPVTLEPDLNNRTRYGRNQRRPVRYGFSNN